MPWKHKCWVHWANKFYRVSDKAQIENTGRLKEKFQTAWYLCKTGYLCTRVGGCTVQSRALFVSHIPENNKFYIKSNIWLFRVDGGYLPDNGSCVSGRAPACAGATERAFCKALRPSEKHWMKSAVQTALLIKIALKWLTNIVVAHRWWTRFFVNHFDGFLIGKT